VLFSLIRIIAGFFSAVICAIFLAVLAASSDWIQAILHPVMLLIKSTPVASFIIIVLLWSGSQNLASIISFLMVLPVIYTNTLQGILNTDKKLLQMAQVFKIPLSKKVRLIYLHDVMPYFLSGLTVSLGLAWKSGIAAEVIGLPNGSIGERLYQAKIFLSSAELISWTITIILLSFLFERTVLYFVQQFQERIEA
jgi:NitT/TauT family transport system permease protein